MTPLLDNGKPYSPTTSALAMALILTCQVGLVIAAVEWTKNNEKGRSR